MSFVALRSLLDDVERNYNREKAGILSQRDTAVSFIYNLRNSIETMQKQKQAPEVILADVLTKLKTQTPHGINMECDK